MSTLAITTFAEELRLHRGRLQRRLAAYGEKASTLIGEDAVIRRAALLDRRIPVDLTEAAGMDLGPRDHSRALCFLLHQHPGQLGSLGRALGLALQGPVVRAEVLDIADGTAAGIYLASRDWRMELLLGDFLPGVPARGGQVPDDRHYSVWLSQRGFAPDDRWIALTWRTLYQTLQPHRQTPVVDQYARVLHRMLYGEVPLARELHSWDHRQLCALQTHQR